MAPTGKYECPGCGTPVSADELVWPIPEVCEKVLPGEEMPAGECPYCEELIYVSDEKGEFLEESDEG